MPNCRSPQNLLADLDNLRLTRAEERISGFKFALPTKQQEHPRRIKFLQETLDHSRDVHATGQAFALVCATREPGAGV